MLVAQIRTGLLEAGAAPLTAAAEAVVEEAVVEKYSLRAAQRTGLVKYGVLAMLMA
jgi:hypothetical protein